MQRQVRRRHAATRDAGDHVDLLRQCRLAPSPTERRSVEFAENGVREGRGSGASTGEVRHDQHIGQAAGIKQLCQAVVAHGLLGTQRLIGPRARGGARGRAEHDGEQCTKPQELHGAKYSFTTSAACAV